MCPVTTQQWAPVLCVTQSKSLLSHMSISHLVLSETWATGATALGALL